MSAADQEGLTATAWACMRGHRGVLQHLVDAGGDLNQADRQGRTPLDLAALNGDADTVGVVLHLSYCTLSTLGHVCFQSKMIYSTVEC